MNEFLTSSNHRTVTKSTVSVVVPIFNEFETLSELLARLEAVVQAESDYHWEVIFVNDGSSDGSTMLLSKFAGQFDWVTVLNLSRNFGHQTAISAGIDFASGDAVIVMDGDLQDPPELLPKMLDRWLSGFDVVFATRKVRDGESTFKRATAAAFYRILKKFSDVDIPLDTGDFRLMSRPVVNAFTMMRERNRFIRGMVSWVGFSQTAIYYERDKRFDGETKFTVLKMARFAVDGLLSFSTVPLQWMSTLGFIISAFSFMGILAICFMALFTSIAVPGWSSLMVGILMMGGIQLIALGMIGEYISRIFDEVRGRPLYLISKIESRRLNHTPQTLRPSIREMTLYDLPHLHPAPSRIQPPGIIR